MLEPPDTNSSVATADAPLIFISHDTRDADLADAFGTLIHNVSSNMLDYFQSSDYTGAHGIEYGGDWYSEILKKLKGASHVVCLLTERSLNRPWILYEAGLAKGKLDTPVTVVALGIPLSQASTGPFAQFKNCDDDEKSLSALVRQLMLKQFPRFQARDTAIAAEVKAFKELETEVLKRIAAAEAPEGSLPVALQKLRENWENYRNSHRNDPYRNRFKLYAFCGLTDTPESDDAAPERDLEDVYYLWADAGAGSSVQAQVLREDSKKLIRITFDAKETGHPSNVAIRIKGRSLIYKEGGFDTLKFSARIPTDIPEGDLTRVQMGIRIVDALKTHWIYSFLEGYKALVVDYNAAGTWTEYIVDLSSQRWKVFETDGNTLYHDDKPDFSMILAVVVEVGECRVGRAGGGKGLLEIKDFSVE